MGKSRDDVLAFARRDFEHGVPYGEARSLGPSALPVLNQLLQDRSEEQDWSNVVSILGFIGRPESSEVLIKFLDSFDGEVSLDTFRALILVPPALGHIARGGAPKTLEYLTEGTRASNWRARSIRWTFGNYSGEALEIVLAKVSVNGLGISGSLQAKDALNALTKTPESPTIAHELEPNIRESLELIEQLRSVGADRLWATSQRRGPKRAGPKRLLSKKYALTIRRHKDSSFSDDDATSLLAKASTLLQEDDKVCPDEIACDVALERDGAVGTFEKAKSVVSTKAEVDAVFAEEGNIKVILTGAGGCGATPGTAWRGCTRTGTVNMILQKGALEATWAHEFGHAKGLHDYTGDCDGNIMLSGGGTQRKAATDEQCAAYVK